MWISPPLQPSIPVVLVVLACLVGTACSDGGGTGTTASTSSASGDGETSGTSGPSGTSQQSFDLSSSAFGDGEPIPVEFTCDGDDLEVPLRWTGAPAGTGSFALVMDDPDAPTAEPFVHWLVSDISPDAAGIAAGSDVGVEGQSGAGSAGYFGPCPPPGEVHTYHFTLYALEDEADPDAPAPTTASIEQEAASALATAELTGTYERAAGG